MRKIVEDYLKSPSKEVYAKLTTMEQKYVDAQKKDKDEKKSKKLTGIG
jgi:hypothetical protein